MSKILNEDIKFYKDHNIHGVIEDGSQRCFFPTGFAFYTYARTLYDASLTFEELREDYFSHAFGEDWRQFYDYLERLGNAFSLEFLSGDANIGKNVPEWFDPSRVEALRSVSDIVKEGRELINAHYNSEDRVRTVSVRLLEFHARYAELLAELVILKATGDDDGALAFYKKMRDECGKYELQFERWYDHGLYFNFILRRLMRLTPKDAFNAIDAI